MRKSFVKWGLGLLLFTQADPAPGQTAQEIEDLFWRSVECESARQVELYLETYPNGAYVAEAHACLEGQLGLDRAAQRLVQQGLAAVGYDPGPADGLFGAKPGTRTRTAIRAWQVAKGMEETGYLTREQADTLLALGRETVAEQREQEEARRQARAEAERKRQEEEARRQAQEAERRRAVEAEQQAREAERQRQEEARRAAEAERQARAEAERQRQTCAGRAEGAECWIELAGRPGCHVFMVNFEPGDSATWTGECADGLVHGMGTLIFAQDGHKDAYTGLIQDGKRRGHFVVHYASGAIGEGPYVDGKAHGHWIQREADGDVWEGPYVNGKLHGHWVMRRADGDIVSDVTYVHGERQDQ